MDNSASCDETRIADYSHFFNTVARRRLDTPYSKSSDHKKQIPIDKQVCLDAGFPHDMQYAMVKATMTCRDGSEIHINPEDMMAASKYGTFRGLPGIRGWIEGLYKRVHNPPTMDDKQLPSSLALQLISGGREGVSKTFASLLECGDSLLAEEAIYQGIMGTFVPFGVKGVPIRSDTEGMDAAHLRQVLSEWKEETQGRRPQILYTIPTCSNPTGKTWSERRKKEIYHVARQFNLLIIEDDPYYYFQFSEPRVPSFLSLDTDGRVIRADSFSKTLSPGSRVGMLFGPMQIIQNIQKNMFADTGGCSGLAQMMIYKLVESWGYDGFLEHTSKLAKFYKQRAEVAVHLANKYLTGLCEWQKPDGGMFMWFELTRGNDAQDVDEELMKRGVFLMVGSHFTLDRSPIPNIRLCYSRASDEELEKGISVLADVLKNGAQPVG